MSVTSTPPTDTSTANANWGTLVILLVVVIAALVIGYVATNGNHPQPTAITASPAP